MVTTYDLYLESGPKRRKTMVHALGLLGCVANGPTTEAALDATPEAIRAFLRFLARHGGPVDPAAAFETRIVEHITEGAWLGNGSPYLVFGPDLDPLTDAEITMLLTRSRRICGELAGWADALDGAELDAEPIGGGRPARAVLLHVIGAHGAGLAAALASAPGFSRLRAAAERVEIPLGEALRRIPEMTDERIRATTPEERNAVRHLPSGPNTLRKALRGILEHGWEHWMELARR